MRRCASAVLLCVVLGSGCGQGLPWRWTDPSAGFDVYSDFEAVAVEQMFGGELRRRMHALQRLFAVDSVAGLEVHVHDRALWQVDNGLQAAGWHGGGEVHVMAGWQGFALAMPTVESTATLLHEFVHALVAQSGLDLPRWFEEGLCEVLAASPLDEQGELVWMPDGARERAVRAPGRWLSAPELFAFVDHYPDDPHTARALYAEAAAFVWFLGAAEQPRDRGAIAALAAMPADEAERRFAAFEHELRRTSVAARFRPFLGSPSPAVREAAVEGAGPGVDDDAWWQDAVRLFDDPDPGVRAALRLTAICRPAADARSLQRYWAWSDSSERPVRLSGQLALALCGELAPGIAFCRALTADDDEWMQPLLWLVLCVPAADGGRRTMPLAEFVGGGVEGREAFGAFARALADDLEALADRLDFDRTAGVYRLR